MTFDIFPIITLSVALISTITIILFIVGLNVLTKKTFSIGLLQSLAYYERYTKFSHENPLLSENEQYHQIVALGVSLAPKDVIFSKTKSKEWWTIYTPRWRGKHFMENAPLRQSLKTNFLEKLESIPGKKALCAVTIQAIRFISNITTDLKSLDIVTMDLNLSAPKDRRVILFDLVVNTGRTMYEAYEISMGQNRRSPHAFATLLFNDFLPVYYRESYEKWIYSMFYQQMKTNGSFYLFSVTNLIPYFDEHVSETLNSIRNRLLNHQLETVEMGEDLIKLRECWTEMNLPFEP